MSDTNRLTNKINWSNIRMCTLIIRHVLANSTIFFQTLLQDFSNEIVEVLFKALKIRICQCKIIF